MKLTFGKYKGKTKLWVKKNDLNYYEWASNNIEGFEIKKVIKSKKIKVIKEEELNNEPCNINYKWCEDFKWHESYPSDISDRLKVWFKNR